MSEKIEGVVLDAIRFKENSVIAKVFTKDYGLVTILINGLGARKSRLSFAYLQPLTHVEFLFYFKDNRGVNKVSDLVVINSSFGTVNNFVKNSIAQFIAEIVIRTSKGLLKDQKVYFLLLEIVRVMLIDNQIIKSLHVYFLVRYLDILGFTVLSEQRPEYFKSESILEDKLINLTTLKEFSHLEMSKSETKTLLNYLLTSLRSNLGMFDVQSFKILEEVMA